MISFHIGRGYELVLTQVMVGLHTAIYVKKGLMHHISDPLSTSLATGVGNIVGNKGAIGICLKFGETSLLFINAHLAGIILIISTRRKSPYKKHAIPQDNQPTKPERLFKD